MKIIFSLTPSFSSYKLDAKQRRLNKLMDNEIEYTVRVVARTATYLLELGMPMPDMEIESEEQRMLVEQVLEQVCDGVKVDTTKGEKEVFKVEDWLLGGAIIKNIPNGMSADSSAEAERLQHPALPRV